MAKTIGFPFSLLIFFTLFRETNNLVNFSLYFFKQRFVASFRFNFFAFKFFVLFCSKYFACFNRIHCYRYFPLLKPYPRLLHILYSLCCFIFILCSLCCYATVQPHPLGIPNVATVQLHPLFFLLLQYSVIFLATVQPPYLPFATTSFCITLYCYIILYSFCWCYQSWAQQKLSPLNILLLINSL